MLTFARPEASIFALQKTNAMKDSIDFGSMEIPKLFRKLLIPTVLGMVFSAVFVITDGIFVGRGIGSDALAAINITAPLFLISTGVGLMFGVGASVVASIHLAQGKVKAARINVTQAVAVSSLLLAAYSFLITSCAREVALLLGSSERLLPLAVEYMHWFAPFLPFSALLSSGMFFIRLDGSPNYAMLCNAVPAVINIVLDYVFIFILGWGMTGAALATMITVLAYNAIRIASVWKFYRIQPFALSDLLVVVLAAGCIGASALVPPMGHFIADGLIRSALVAALYGGAVYSLKLSPEINRTIDRTLSRLGIRLGRRA